MISFKPGVLMFNTKAIRNHVDRATRKVLSKFGAFVRQTAKRSIRKRKSASPPGSPPSSHIGLLKRFIWFGYEPNKRSVVIGPARLSIRSSVWMPCEISTPPPSRANEPRPGSS